ncbi:MAG: DUF302 domain-containing protein [Bacteroidales bacterium]|nr:DUF302 domain-containing protein [Bacteroidales bacterium]
MEYYIGKTVEAGFDHTVERVKGLLNGEGFGVLTEIDVSDTLKKKLDVDFKRYLILGACNPHFAHQAFRAEDKIGVLLPCNVVIIDQGSGRTEVALMDAMSVMKHTGNPKLARIADEISCKLRNVIDKL